jgi:hypothetical protein
MRHDKQQRRLEVTMEELFTKEELDRARKILGKYKAKPRYFREQKVSDEVVRPKINQINAYAGYNCLPECWAYALEHYFKLKVCEMSGRGNASLNMP